MLTDPRIKALRPREKPYAVTDEKGLYLEILPSGTKVWRYRYRLNGRREKVSLGKYPDVTLKKAREKRLKLAGEVADDRSPAEQRRRRRAQRNLPSTVEPFAEVWLEEVVSKARKDVSEVRAHLKRDVYKTIGTKNLVDVTPGDVLAITDRIKKRGADQSALVVRNILRRMYAFAIARQLVPTNPAAAIEPRYIAAPKARTRALSPDELGKVLRAVYDSDMNRRLKLGLHQLVLTLTRKSELINARWEHIELAAGEWTIPETKQDRPHIVYLSRQSGEIFAKLHDLATGSAYALPSRSRLTRPISKTTFNSAIKTIDFEIDHFVLHDFRRTGSTLLHEAGFPSDVIEMALGHAIGGVRGVYNRALYREQRRMMLQQWADMVDSWVENRSNVSVMHGGRRQ